MLEIQYGVFILLAAAICIFTGPSGRRYFCIALAGGAAATFLVRVIHFGVNSDAMLLMQILAFPSLVMCIWVVLFMLRKMKDK